jgi:hypothetical protein
MDVLRISFKTMQTFPRNASRLGCMVAPLNILGGYSVASVVAYLVEIDCFDSQDDAGARYEGVR